MNEIDTLEKLNDNQNAQSLMRRTTDVAGVCKEIVLKTAVNIQGKKYVRCEGWQAIATAHGCIAGSRDVKKIEGGYQATGEVRRISDGVLLAQAEGFVGMDETNTWAKRPEYACRAMAQTRAISRVCRAAFAHVVVLMDAGLSTTPFEEVPDGGFDNVAQDQSKPVSGPPRENAGHSDKMSMKDWPDGDVTLVAVLDNFDQKPIHSKKNGKDYVLTTLHLTSKMGGRKFDVITWKGDKDALEVLQGQDCSIAHKPDRDGKNRELVNIQPNDDLPM